MSLTLSWSSLCSCNFCVTINPVCCDLVIQFFICSRFVVVYLLIKFDFDSNGNLIFFLWNGMNRCRRYLVCWSDYFYSRLWHLHFDGFVSQVLLVFLIIFHKSYSFSRKKIFFVWVKGERNFSYSTRRVIQILTQKKK